MRIVRPAGGPTREHTDGTAVIAAAIAGPAHVRIVATRVVCARTAQTLVHIEVAVACSGSALHDAALRYVVR